MNGVGFLGAIIIGIAAGFIAEKVMHRNQGLLTNLIVGLVGSVLGSFVVSLLGLGGAGWIWSLIVSTIGAILLLFLWSLVTRKRA
jgi:uncharacterized membrane protein YeaQ/YmgE (transglycosylase-associated protein family)